MSTWPEEVLQKAQATAHLIMGNLFRRFVVQFWGWPWKLAYMFDTTLTWAERRKVVREFLEAHLCCLDELFGLRLRNLVHSEDDMFK